MRSQELRDLLVLAGISTVLGLGHLAIRQELPWVAEPSEPKAEACSVDEVAPLVERISVEEARGLVGQPGVSFVDARDGDQYVAGHVPGALSLPAGEAAGILEVQSVPIPAEDMVITYCDSRACERSEYLGVLLRDRAVCDQVRVLAGGWKAWTDEQGPVETGASEP